MLKPIGEKLLIERDIKEKKTSIILVDEEEAQVMPSGIVIEIGTDIDGTVIAPGDKVYFSELAGEEVVYEDKKYLIIKLSNVLAKVC